MAANATLSAQPREGRGKGAARKLRQAGRIPAVVYGRHEQTREISVDAHELERLFSHISVDNTLITLRIDGDGGGEIRTLVREVQTHPYRSQVLHVDFYQIHAGEAVTVELPILLTGTAAGVRAGGILQQTMHSFEVRCLPDKIPENVTADVSALEIGDSLHISDLALPRGVETDMDPTRTVCSIITPAVMPAEETPEVPEGPGGDVEPEVIRRRSAEEEEAGE